MSNIIIKDSKITSSGNINLCGTELIFGNSSNNSNFNFRSINDNKFNFTGSINYKNINNINDYFYTFKTKKFDDFTSSKNDNYGGGTHTKTYTSGTLFYSESIGLNFINTNISSIKLGGVLFTSYKGSTLQNFSQNIVNLFTGSYNYSALVNGVNIPFVPLQFFGSDKIYNPLEYFKNINMLKFKINGNIYISSSKYSNDNLILFYLSSSFNIEKYNNSNNLIGIDNISYFVENKKNDEFVANYANNMQGSYPFILHNNSIGKGTGSFSDYIGFNKVPYTIDFILLNKGITGNNITFFTKGNFYHNFSNILVNVSNSFDYNISKGTWYLQYTNILDMTSVNYIKFNFNFKTENVNSNVKNMYISTDNVIVETY